MNNMLLGLQTLEIDAILCNLQMMNGHYSHSSSCPVYHLLLDLLINNDDSEIHIILWSSLNNNCFLSTNIDTVDGSP